MKPEFYQPVAPLILTQDWGVYNPAYLPFGWGRHNGEDYAHGVARLVRAPFDFECVRTGYQPNGGGVFNGIISQSKFLFPDNKSVKVLWDSLHLDRNVLAERQTGKAGDIIGIAGNTGFSTGPHTHVQPRRVNWDGIRFTEIDRNDANNSFDPSPFYVPTPALTFATNLHFGMSSPEVKKLQIVLYGLGYFDYPEFTFYYGPATKKAVFEFQLDHVPMTWTEHLYRGYYFGPKSRRDLNEILADR